MSNSNERIFSRNFTLLFLSNFLVNMGAYMQNVLIPKFANSMGASSQIIGTIVSMFAVSALVLRPVTGPAIQSFHKKMLLIASLLIISCAQFGYSISDTPYMIMAFRLLHGVGNGVVAVLCLTMASNSLPESKMASGIGIYSVGQVISSAVGPTLGLGLANLIGYNRTFICTGCLYLLAAVCDSFISYHEDNRPPFQIKVSNFLAKEAVAPALLMCLLSVAYSFISSFLVLCAESRGIANVSYFFTVYAVILVVFRPLCGRIADKRGAAAVIYPSLAAYVIGMILIANASSLVWILAAGVFIGLGFGVSYPQAQTLAVQSVEPKRRGVAGTTGYIGADAGNLIGPVFAGQMVALAGYDYVFYFAIIPIVAAVICSWLYFKKKAAVHS